MSVAPFTRSRRRIESGSALIIVLFFVILLTVITVAFLSRSLTAVKVSASSASETKASSLANSAGDIIIGDLKQEIIAGSGGASVGTSAAWPLYVPASNLTMIPFQNGIPTTGTAIPNMISRSVSPSNTGGAAPYIPYTTNYTSSAIPPNRAAQDSTAATSTYSTSKVNSSTPSLNGRFVGAAQWNSHYLIPRNPTVDSPGSTTADSTPATSFVPPDWIVVTRGGATSVPWSSGSGGLNDSTLGNKNYAIGRYAYAIYNEGGLLDMNVAGFPADPTNPGAAGSNGLTSTQISEKGSLALADLTQLSSAATGTITQAQINDIVGWRNYASAGLTSSNGSFGSFNFTPATAGNWLTNFVTANTNGFMRIVTPTGATTPPTDQAFLSRQQLISLTQSLSISPDLLQYLGTFSRSLEQPSYTPDPARPTILSNGLPPPTAGGTPSEDTYIGNNDAEGGDSSANPSFLAQRVVGTWNRFNGQAAVVGEPLVKTRFPLSRLALVAYNATNATAAATYGTTANPDPIYDYFGLKRTSASSPWVYNHGGAKILTLTQVKSGKREADFAELLKSAIVAGSLAKAGPNLNLGNNNYQYTLDSSIDLQVIQIMANLIDQQDTDSYPTVIQINGRTVYGVEDLPYFYRYHLFSVVDTAPAMPLSNANNVVFPAVPAGATSTGSISTALDYTNPSATPQSVSWPIINSYPATVNGMQPGSVSASTAGEATYLYIPDLWNPHDQNTLASETSSLRPTNFRIYATTDDPLSATHAWNLGVEAQFTGSNNVAPVAANPTAVPPVAAVAGQSAFTSIVPENDTVPKLYYWPISDPEPMVAPASYNTSANNVMYFSDNSGTLFREPTLLWNANPTGISLAGSSVKDANTGKTYYGIVAGKVPVQMQVTIKSNPAQGTDGSYIVQGNDLSELAYVPAGAYTQITFFLQYQDPNNSSNWITYDVKYPDLHGLSAPNLVVNTTTDYPNYQNVLLTGQFPGHATSFDPRTARWGIGTASSLGEISPGTHGNSTGTTGYPLQPLANSNYNSATLGGFSVMETDRSRGDKGNQVNYSNPCMTTNPGQNVQMHWYSGTGFSASNGQTGSPLQYNGLFSQNNPAIVFNSRGGGAPPVAETPGSQLYVEDADGVARLAMGGYASTTLTDTSTSSQYVASDTNRIGLPMATASTVADTTAVATPTPQTQSRPLVLNRPFRSVSEMSYAFRGTPWKNIDFFNPASGDSALLDTFCLKELPANSLIAGKVDLNTRQAPVLQAIVAGAYRDEYNNVSSPPTYALPPLSGAEAANVAAKLEGITTDTTHAWRGPLENISSLVGHFVANPGTTSGFTDVYTYTPATPDTTHGQLASMTYAGLSGALDSTVYTNTTNSASTSAPIIQRFREAAIRPLADAGQVRVWNLLIDVVAQTGHYPKSATGLDQFLVDGQKRAWIHVAIDRLTGQVLDKQVEFVTP